MYACANAGVVCLCIASKLEILKRLSLVVSIGWLASIAAYFELAPLGLTWGYTVISFMQAALFWRMSGAAAAPLPLFGVATAAIVVNLLATVSSVNFWWSAFALNRLFDLMLFYITGCALYRIYRLRQKQKGAPMARPQSPGLFASA